MDPRSFEADAAGSPPTAPTSPSLGYHTDGNPGLSIPASYPGPYYWHAQGEELRNLIVAAGLTPDADDLTQVLTAIRAIAQASSPPPGCVMHTAAAAAPTGWLICDGAAVSRSTYAALFAAIGTTYGAGNGTTTFNLPDLRGEFIRGLDLSRGVDAARSLGSAQSDAVEVHSHYLPTETAAGPDFWAFKDNANTPNGITTTSAPNSFPATPGGSFYTLDDTETHPSLGPETRPRNVALTPIIKT